MVNMECEWMQDPELRELFTEFAAAIDGVNVALDEIDAVHGWAGELAERHGGRVCNANRDFVEVDFNRHPTELEPLVAESLGEMELFEGENGRAPRLMIYLRQP